MQALEAGAEDILVDEETFTVVTAMEDLHKVNEALEKSGVKAQEVGLLYTPTNKAELTPEDQVKLLRLLDALDDLDDVQETYVNVDIAEEALQEA